MRLLEGLAPEQKAQVEAVSMDMWPAFLAARHSVLPHADTVHDRFHIAAYLAQAVDLTRRQEHRFLSKESKAGSVLSQSKYLWLKNPEHFTPHQHERFAALMEADLETARAWAVKENFRHFFACQSVEAGRLFFAGWGSRSRRWAIATCTKSPRCFKSTSPEFWPISNTTPTMPVPNRLMDASNSSRPAPEAFDASKTSASPSSSSWENLTSTHTIPHSANLKSGTHKKCLCKKQIDLFHTTRLIIIGLFGRTLEQTNFPN